MIEDRMEKQRVAQLKDPAVIREAGGLLHSK